MSNPNKTALSTSAKHRLERERKRLERVRRARLERNQCLTNYTI